MKNGPKIFEKSQKTFKKLLKITFVQKLLTHPLCGKRSLSLFPKKSVSLKIDAKGSKTEQEIQIL